MSLSHKLKSFRRSNLGRILFDELYDIVEAKIISNMLIDTQINNAILDITYIEYCDHCEMNLDIKKYIRSYQQHRADDPHTGSIILASLVRAEQYGRGLASYGILDILFLAIDNNDTLVINELTKHKIDGITQPIDIKYYNYYNNDKDYDQYLNYIDRLKLYEPSISIGEDIALSLNAFRHSDLGSSLFTDLYELIEEKLMNDIEDNYKINANLSILLRKLYCGGCVYGFCSGNDTKPNVLTSEQVITEYNENIDRHKASIKLAAIVKLNHYVHRGSFDDELAYIAEVAISKNDMIVLPK